VDVVADAKIFMSALRTLLFHVVHPGIAAIVCSVLGQVCSIVVHGLCWYNTFNSAKVQYMAYYNEH